MLAFSVFFLLVGGQVARSCLFRVNLHGYKAVVGRVLDGPRRSSERLPLGPVRATGLYSIETVRTQTDLEVWFNTGAGPTLETVVFSPTQLAFLKPYTLRQVLKDDLGYWYFADPVQLSD